MYATIWNIKTGLSKIINLMYFIKEEREQIKKFYREHPNYDISVTYE